MPQGRIPDLHPASSIQHVGEHKTGQASATRQLEHEKHRAQSRSATFCHALLAGTCVALGGIERHAILLEGVVLVVDGHRLEALP